MSDHKFEDEARKIFLELHSDKKLGWKKIGELIHKYIGLLDIKNVPEKPYKRAWETVFRENGAKNSDELFWKDLVKIGQAIKAEAESASGRQEGSASSNYPTEFTSGKPFIYTVAKLQDTILPILHKPAIMRLNHVKFEEQRHWNECLEALISEKVDVALHNFPTALAYMSNPDASGDIFFWPFFVFHGYALFVRRASVRKYCQSHGLAGDSYHELEQSGKEVVANFLRNCEIVVECYTDTEYALKDYVTRFGVEWNGIKLTNEPINEGKQKFKKDGIGDILCTNSLHVLDLQNLPDQFELIAKGEGVTRHNNFNGLICTMEFYHSRPYLVKGLIDSWFGCMKDTLAEWNIIQSSSEFKDGDINNFIYQSMLNYLQEVTFSDKILLDKFIKSFTGNNTFFPDANTAYHRLTEMLSIRKDMERNWEIADMQNKGQRWDNHLMVEDKIKKNMQEISKYILK